MGCRIVSSSPPPAFRTSYRFSSPTRTSTSLQILARHQPCARQLLHRQQRLRRKTPQKLKRRARGKEKAPTRPPRGARWQKTPPMGPTKTFFRRKNAPPPPPHRR